MVPAQAPVVHVIVPRSLPGGLDYAWAGDQPPVVGQLVVVEVGKQLCHGVVQALPTQSDYAQLKPAQPLTPTTVLPPAMMRFLDWVARYNLATPGDVWRAALPGGEAPAAPIPPQVWALAKDSDSLLKNMRLTPERQKVVEVVSGRSLHSPIPGTQAALATAAGVSLGVVAGLCEAGVVQRVDAPMAAAAPAPRLATLNPAQQAAAEALTLGVRQRAFWPAVLDGVTGSGKTEVYLAAIADMLQRPQGQALVLVPEIALTPQWLARFQARFGFMPAVWHSATAQGAKASTWWGVLQGNTRVVVGARSALFLPFCDLQLVVVDEEHDPSYKQDEGGLIYHARDMAIVRAQLSDCPVLLTSATPSLETWHKVLQGKYTHLSLPTRFNDAQLPQVQVVDLTKHSPAGPQSYISAPLQAALTATLAKGEQALLFLNRRGYAPLLICRACGHRCDCPRCSASLVVHGHHLECHHCGYREAQPEACPSCGATDKLQPFGPGTRRIAEEVQRLLPQARVAVADRDSLATPKQLHDVITQLERGEIDVLVGTQMVAKGHHFPQLTLVGVVDADLGLAQGDLRAAERTFQLLTQVAGRAGRGDKPGQVLLQTHLPDHPLMQALQRLDRDAFYQLELNARQGMPPYTRLTALILSGADDRTVAYAAQNLAAQCQATAPVRLLGPAPAALHKRKDVYRHRLLLMTPDAPHKLLHHWLAQARLPKGVTLRVDVDPQSFG